MFKNNKLILVLLICLVTFAIGYALFTGSVNISSTAKLDPTNINISTTCGIIEYSDSLNYDTYWSTSSGVENSEINCSGTNVQWSAQYLYPGASQGYWIEITNNSNFNVRFKNIEIVGNEETSEYKDLIQGIIFLYDKQKNQIINHSASIDLFLLEKNTNESIACSNNSCLMKPNSTYTILIKEYINSSLTNNNLDMQSNRTINLNFEQSH